MKVVIVFILALSTLLVGATCFPLFDLNPTPDSGETAKTLAISVIKPDQDRTVKAGATVKIQWTASNLTDATAFATVSVFSSNDDETILQGGIRVSESPGTQTYNWVTDSNNAAFSGEYTIQVKIEAGDETAEDTAAGLITVNQAPSFEFTAPTANMTLVKGEPEDPNDPNSPLTAAEIEISWVSSDANSDGAAKISLDPDRHTDDPKHDSGNEITIYETTIPRTSGTDSIQWDGADTDGTRVDADTYTLFAIVTDDVNDEQRVVAWGTNGNSIQITVPEEVTASVEPSPAEDTSLLIGASMTVRYTLNEDNDVYLDFQVDPDDDHTNGNEVTIRSRDFVEKGTEVAKFKWKGRDADGNLVGFDGRGVFSLLMIIDRGTSSTETVASENHVQLRDAEDTPVISLIEPATDVTVTGGTGGQALIKWRDDDPDETAKIRLVIDDDATPNEGVETDDAEITLPSADFGDLASGGSGLQATYRYYIADNLAPGRYWVFAYIDRDEAAPWDDIAIAGGQIVIEDPDATN